MEYLVATMTLAALALYAYESHQWRSERSRLLDRIMAKTYTDFVYTTRTEADAATVAVAPEAPDLAWHEQNQKDHPEQYPDGIEAYD